MFLGEFSPRDLVKISTWWIFANGLSQIFNENSPFSGAWHILSRIDRNDIRDDGNAKVGNFWRQKLKIQIATTDVVCIIVYNIKMLLGVWIFNFSTFSCFAMIKHISASQKIQSFHYFYDFKTVFARTLLYFNYSMKTRVKTLIKHEKWPKDSLS